jgi:TolB-like protein
MTSKPNHPPGIMPDAAIREQLDKILSSDWFRKARRLSRLLRYAVEHTASGGADNFKEFLLGVEVFDKPPSFDPRLDSIVRVEVCRLRSRLRNYYETDGRRDAILIEFSKGNYVPEFKLREFPAVPDPIPTAAAPWRSRPPIVAVLPFVDFSSANDQEYFADGLTEEIIQALTRIPGLQVVAQTSVFQYKHQPNDVRRIGRDLEADAVMEGSLRKAGQVLRITAQLANVATGCILWSETYERMLQDVFAVQEEISRSIVEAIHGHLFTIVPKTGLQGIG